MASKAVNRPTDPKQRDLDVSNKLQLYGIYSAFANGKVPSNKQIDIALNSVLQSKALASPSGRLSEEGRKLVADLREVIEQAKVLLLTKNDGNLLQDFIWQTEQISGGNASTPNAPLSKEEARQHGQQALEGLRTLGTLIITNGQFRKLLNDAVILFRDIAGDAATKAAGKVNPTEDQLNQIDDPAEENTWHDAPDLSRDKLRDQAKESWNTNKPFGKGELKNAAGDATQAAHPGDSRDPADAAALTARDQQQGTQSGVDAATGVRAGADTLRSHASGNIPEDKKDKGREYRDRTKGYLQTKVPKERREQTIWRLKKMVVEIQGHQDYQRAIDTLLSLAETYTGHSRNVASQSSGAVKGAHTDDSLKTAEADLKTLIERFANSTSLDDVFDSINQIYRDADKDPELKNWFRAVDAYIRKCLKEQGFIMEDSATDEYNRLYDQGEYLLRDKYRSHTDRIIDEFRFLGNQFDADPLNRRFGDSVQKLFLDLGNDENGKATFKPHLIKDLTEVIIPAFLINVQYVPIPRIEYSDPMVDVVVENLVVESDNLAPNVLEFSTDNYWRWGRKQIANKNKNKVMLAVSGVQMDLRDVSFYVKRKQGFPSLSDTGICDIFMGGSGLSFKIAAETADANDRVHFFKIHKIDVDIKNVNIKMKKSKHKILFALAKPILLKVLRPAIQKVIEKQIKDSAHRLDALAWGVHQEVKRAEAEAKRNPDPEHVQNMYERYVNAAKTQVLQGKRKAEQISQDKKVNMAVTQQDSILPNIKLPGGISTKATEYKELARKGDKWESPVFGIGSAKETSGLPKLEPVSRKAHNTATGRISDSVSRGYDSNSHAYDNSRAYANNSLTTGATNLGNQMDDAFNPHANGQTAAVNGSAAKSPTNMQGHNTTLYDQNPVLTGRV
jgi:hypothetical protein